LDDNEILSLYFTRAESAVVETAKKYGNYCFAIAKKILNSNQDAEECVNDTYFRAWNAIPPDRPTFLQAFLGKITRNLSFNKYKQNRTAKRGGGDIALLLSELEDCVPSSIGVEAQYESNLTAVVINDCLLTMDKESRIVFVRRYYYADSIKDIAARFEMSESKVKSMLFRARNKLREHLEKEGVTI